MKSCQKDVSLKDVEEHLVQKIKDKENEEEEHEEEEQEDGEQDPPPSVAQMRTALNLLHRGLQESDFPAFNEFWNMEKTIKQHFRHKYPPKQTSIDLFFRHD